MYDILEAGELAPGNKFIKVRAPWVARRGQAGQFAILRIDEGGERIPLTLADWDRKAGTVTFIFQEVGSSSRRLGTLKAGDGILDVVGPLGVPTHAEQVGTVVAMGGGLGIAPLRPIAAAFKQSGNRVITIIGARSQDLLFWEDELAKVSDELIICTDDGSKGMKGFVTQALVEVMKRENPGLVFAIGPAIMMRSVAQATREFGIKTVVSLNPIMIDGTGMCGGCRVEVGGKTFFACVDGPDFDAHLVDFDLLMARQRMYLDQEARAKEMSLHDCKIGLTPGSS